MVYNIIYINKDLANLMVMTIYGNGVKSHDHINDISELSSKIGQNDI